MSQLANIKILAVDDDEGILTMLKVALSKKGYLVDTVSDGFKALEYLKKSLYDLVITDMSMPIMDGIQLLQKVKDLNPVIPVMVITAFGSIQSAVEAVKLGASDYLTKPFNPIELQSKVENIIEKQRLSIEVQELRNIIKERDSFNNIVGNSVKMESVFEQLSQIVKSDATVLIYGESGTGKELIARAIHYGGARADKPFITVNSGAIPPDLMEDELFGHIKGAFTGAVSDRKGLFEEADTGTIFLDEISVINQNLQVKLLRVLQEQEIRRVGESKNRKINVRIIAATNKDLKELVNKNEFREDLYYRINVLTINIPPLRERKEDIPLLVNHFLKIYSKQFNKKVEGFSPALIHKMMLYSWPGNVRELENKIQQAVVMARRNILFPEDVDIPIDNKDEFLNNKNTDSTLEPFKVAKERVVSNFEKNYIIQALKLTAGNVSKSAKLAGKDRKDFWNLMKKHNIKADDFRK